MDWFDIDHNGIVDGRDFFMAFTARLRPVFAFSCLKSRAPFGANTRSKVDG